jgi:hypothetical protein
MAPFFHPCWWPCQEPASASCVIGAVHTYYTYQNLQPQTLVSAVPYQLLERFSPLINLSDPLLIRATCSFAHRWNQPASTTFYARSVLSIGCVCEESSYCFVFGPGQPGRQGRTGRLHMTLGDVCCAATLTANLSVGNWARVRVENGTGVTLGISSFLY